MAEAVLNISIAEWEIMRIVWANEPVTGREVIDYLQDITEWKEGTIKSMMNRLQTKGMIEAEVDTKPFRYRANVSENEANLIEGESFMDRICAKDRVNLIAHFIQGNELSKDQINDLMTMLENKLVNAPDEVECTCPVGQCHCHLHTK